MFGSNGAHFTLDGQIVRDHGPRVSDPCCGVIYQMTPERDQAQQGRVARAMSTNDRQAAQIALEQRRARSLLRLAFRERKLSGKATSE
jgi:hypothetical protein